MTLVVMVIHKSNATDCDCLVYFIFFGFVFSSPRKWSGRGFVVDPSRKWRGGWWMWIRVSVASPCPILPITFMFCFFSQSCAIFALFKWVQIKLSSSRTKCSLSYWGFAKAISNCTYSKKKIIILSGPCYLARGSTCCPLKHCTMLCI